MASIEESVRHLEAVTAEIKSLRDSVARHRDATLGLEAIATSLSTLSSELERLPGGVRAEFSEVAELVEQLRKAFLPAGSLHVSLNDLSRRVDQAASEVQVATAQFREELSATREELRDLKVVVIDGQETLRGTVQDIVSGIALSLRQELSGTREELRDLRSVVIEGQRDLRETAREVQSNLTALNGLSRRGFWDLLRGKSAEPRAFDEPRSVSKQSPESGPGSERD